MEAMRKAPRLTKEDKSEETLDANLWGQLQEYIPLQTIYKKLSQRDLFQLRLVNKEWNHAALQWILPKPSFVTIAACVKSWGGDVRYLNGVVTYNSASGKFKFDCQHLHMLDVWTHVPPFEVEGLILCHNPDDLKERGVFNVHIQTWHAIPVGPRQSKSDFVCGLLVDTTVKPYTFKLIEGHLNFPTQIYDSKSRSWSKTCSQLPSSVTKSQLGTLEYSCVGHNDNLYMFVNSHMILKYSLKDDKWTKVRNLEDNLSLDNTLGIWAGKIFTTTKNDNEQRITVWEFVDSKRQEWVEYACMPKEQYKCLWKCDFDGFHSYKPCLRSFYCDGYLLVCCWHWDIAYANELVLFNIATKTWQKMDLPRGSVASDEQELESFHESKNIEEDEDFDEDDNVVE